MASLSRWHELEQARETVMGRNAWPAAVHGVRVGRNWVTEKCHEISWVRNRTCISPQQPHWQVVSLPLNHKEGWAPRFDAFWLWCWKRLLRAPWRARRSNQSILKEINSEYSWKEWCWSWNSNTLATSREELTHCKKPDAGADWREKEKGWAEDEVVRHVFEQTLGDSGEWRSLSCCSQWGHSVRHNLVTQHQQQF